MDIARDLDRGHIPRLYETALEYCELLENLVVCGADDATKKKARELRAFLTLIGSPPPSGMFGRGGRVD